jgi:long-chain acyl-CoA synthetase
MDRLVEGVNQNLNEWEKIRRYHLVTERPTIEKGEITPSMKLVRGEIEKRFKKEIEAMYGGHI